jgi:hypothetical protein
VASIASTTVNEGTGTREGREGGGGGGGRRKSEEEQQEDAL